MNKQEIYVGGIKMQYEDEEELEFESKGKGIKRLYITEVFKKYGIAYILIALAITLCHAILLVPTVAIKGYKYIEAMINWLSNGNQDWHDSYWAFLIVSLVGIVVIWITNKICDKVMNKKEKK